jgi:hypothetical protein
MFGMLFDLRLVAARARSSVTTHRHRGAFTDTHTLLFTDDTDDIHIDPFNGNLYSSGDAASGGTAGGQAMIFEVSLRNASVLAHQLLPRARGGLRARPPAGLHRRVDARRELLHVLDKGSNKIVALWTVPAPLGGATPLCRRRVFTTAA